MILDFLELPLDEDPSVGAVFRLPFPFIAMGAFLGAMVDQGEVLERRRKLGG